MVVYTRNIILPYSEKKSSIFILKIFSSSIFQFLVSIEIAIIKKDVQEEFISSDTIIHILSPESLILINP